jgi:4-hydroxyphenylpyruvate dioxygenase-like putative hemolysin
MPKFKKSSGFKMKGSPLLKDVKMYEGSGSQITIDDKSLGESYMDEHGNKARDYSYKTKDGKKATDTLYLNKPRFEGSREGDPVVPTRDPLEYTPNLA